MSGIYIPNMHKPTRCGDCPFVMKEDVNWCGRCNYNICDGLVDLNEVPKWCDLFPVPDHGRLIDADALWDKVKNDLGLGFRKGNIIYDAGVLAGFRAAATIALEMPTVIPADADRGSKE